MKILVIWSSANEHGLTGEAKDRFVSGAKSAGLEVEEVWLNSLRMEHCRACGNGWGLCREGKCVQDDDFEALRQKVGAADGVAFVSAVYWQDLTECMKAFLDRLRRCEAFKPGSPMKGKRCFLAACAGGTGLGAVETLHKLEDTLKHMEMRACDRVPVFRFNKDYMLPTMEAAGKNYAEKLISGFDMRY